MKELQKSILRLGKLPQKCVTKAAKKGGSVVLRAAKQKAPIDTGALRRGLKLKGEKTKVKGKKVYEVTFDKEMNNTFVKESKAGNRSYYPASQEYGFKTKNGGYIPGYHYLRDSAVENKQAVETTIVETLSLEIDKVMK
jgi:hypothetical protein